MMMQKYDVVLATAINACTDLPWSDCVCFAKQIERHKQLMSLPVPPRVRKLSTNWEEMRERYLSVNG
jgi:hypothetical protein